MARPMPGFFCRFMVAFSSYWRIISDPDFALNVMRLRQGRFHIGPIETEAANATTTPTPVLKEVTPEAALQLLGLLQQEGRFIDFIQEEVNAFSDAEVGAAARVVHGGCRKAIQEHFTLVSVREEAEGSRITVAEGFDASALRLTGNLTGKPPYSGKMVHRGWQVTRAKLPKLVTGHNVHVLAPAEVEL